MSYREGLIQRFKTEGFWEQMADEDRARYEAMSEDDARQFMVVWDQTEMGDPALAYKVFVAFVKTFWKLFRHTVFEQREDGDITLSPVGKTLAAIIAELQVAGVDNFTMGNDFAKLTVNIIDRCRNGDLEAASALFLGKLVEYDEAGSLRLSETGAKLNRLVRALQAAELPDAEIEADFQQLNVVMIHLFAELRRRSSESE